MIGQRLYTYMFYVLTQLLLLSVVVNPHFRTQSNQTEKKKDDVESASVSNSKITPSAQERHHTRRLECIYVTHVCAFKMSLSLGFPLTGTCYHDLRCPSSHRTAMIWTRRCACAGSIQRSLGSRQAQQAWNTARRVLFAVPCW
jgi:hypothetical protein